MFVSVEGLIRLASRYTPSKAPSLYITPSQQMGVVMRSMNQILADIVIANGGTVSDINNRNQLLKDWLDAL